MLRAGSPNKFTLVWAQNAGGPYIRTVPTTSQIGIQDGAASFNDGFVPDNFTPIAAGGVPPFGQDVNGALNIMTTWDQWFQAGAPIFYDSAFATAIGGYPQGAQIDSAVVLGNRWVSLVDSNTTNPDDPTTSVGWAPVGVPSGMPAPFLTATLPAGWVAMNALTVGNGSSNATGRANADTIFAFAATWLQFSNTQCPILTSAGGNSTRGANPYADFAANKALTLPNGKGLGFIGIDTMAGAASTFLTGVPATIGNSTTPGSILGENLHALLTAELAAHTHSNSLNDPGHTHFYDRNSAQIAVIQQASTGVDQFGVWSSVAASSSGTGMTITNASQGSGSGHNTVHRSMGVFWGMKL